MCSVSNPPLPDLDSLPLALVLVVLARTVALIWLPGLGAVPSKVSGTPTIKATIGVLR
jgi:hypothetical protein